MEDVRAYLEAHHGDEPAFMAELLAVFLRNAPTLIAGMADHLGTGDVETVRQTAQALKSSSRLIGFARLSALCRALEVATQEDPGRDALEPYVRSIQEAYAAARPSLDAERAELVHLAALQSSV